MRHQRSDLRRKNEVNNFGEFRKWDPNLFFLPIFGNVTNNMFPTLILFIGGCPGKRRQVPSFDIRYANGRQAQAFVCQACKCPPVAGFCIVTVKLDLIWGKLLPMRVPCQVLYIRAWKHLKVSRRQTRRLNRAENYWNRAFMNGFNSAKACRTEGSARLFRKTNLSQRGKEDMRIWILQQQMSLAFSQVLFWYGGLSKNCSNYR